MPPQRRTSKTSKTAGTSRRRTSRAGGSLADPVALARRYMGDADIVLAEGYTRAPIPKIEVFRPSVAPTPIFDPTAPDAPLWAAIVTDDLDFEAPCLHPGHVQHLFDEPR